MSVRLDQFARRLGTDPYFLAAALDSFAASEKCDEAALASRLGCSVATLTHLRLCRMPRPKPPHFWQDVEKIAAHLAVDPQVLAEVVRHGQTLLRFRAEDSSGDVGGLMAARDRPAPQPHPPNPGGNP